jgi:hypothetical protein
MSSIFPTVTVTILKPLTAASKATPLMPVGIIGPTFKRFTEIKTNGYAVRPSTAESTAVSLDAVSNSQYIDYDSVEVDLAIAGSDEIVSLKNEDTVVLTTDTVKQSNIFIESDTTGFYKVLGGETVFYPSSGRQTSYNAKIGDFLYLQKSDVTISNKIKKITPTLLSPNNFPSPTSYTNGSSRFRWAAGDVTYFSSWTGGAGTITPAHNYLVLVNKVDKTLYKQFRITSIVTGNGSTNNDIIIDTSKTASLGNIEIDLDYTTLTGTEGQWDYYIYDMPLGGLVTYNTTVYTSDQYVTGTSTNYKIITKNLIVSEASAADGTFGVFAKDADKYGTIFLPDSRATTSYGSANIGDYLRATKISDDTTYDFRIISRTNSVLKSSLIIKNFTVKAASTTNIASLSNPGTATFDGVVLTAGDRLLLKDQTTPAENGIYVFATSSTAMVKATDFDAINSTEIHTGAVVSVTSGTVSAGLSYTLVLTGSDLAFTANEGAYEINVSIPADSTFVNTKAFLVAKNIATPSLTRIFNIAEFYTTGGVKHLYTTNTDFSTDGAGASNALILSDFTDWEWAIYNTPPGSLTVSAAIGDWELVTSSGTNSTDLTDYNFNIINKADFHVSGKTEVTIMNHISGSDGVEIGLADTIIKYNVLETEYASQLWDITTETDRQLVCGDIANYNPIGLASGLAEVNTGFAYKIIPCDIAFTERDPDNPKAYSGRYLVGVANDNYHDVKNLDWLSAYNVLADIKDVNIPYYIIPLSQDASITALSTTTITNLADPDKMKEMITFITTGLINSETLISNINIIADDFEITEDSILRYTPTTKWVSTDEPLVDINFLQLGIKKGDYIVGKINGTESEIKFKVYNIYPDYLDLGTTTYSTVSALVADLDTTERLSIKHIYNNKTDIARALATKSSSIASFRVKMIWGDLCDVSINGVNFISVPSYYAAVAYAAMANAKGVVMPKTNWPINGVTKIYNSNSYFGVDDLEIMGEGFMDILAQDFDGGPVFSKRQFMTDGSELSSVEVVDELAKYIRLLYRPYLGKYNIDSQLYEVLNVVLASIINTYKPRKLNDLQVVEGLTVKGDNSDRISLKLRPVTKKPFNGLDVIIMVS